MSDKYFQLSPISLNGTVLAGIQDVSQNDGIEPYASQSDGSQAPLLVTQARAAPSVTIPTLNVAALLALLASSGPVPYAALSSTGLLWTDKKRATDGPTYVAGSTSEQKAMALGMAWLAGIEAAANTAAVATLMGQGRSSDGTTNPIALATASAPSDPASIAPYFLTAVTVDGSGVDEIDGVSLGFNVVPQIEYGLFTYPRFVHIGNVAPVLDIRHRDASLARSKTIRDCAVSFVLSSVASGGPTRGATTVTFTVNGLLHDANSTRPTSGSSFNTRVVARRNGSTQPVSWAVA